MTTVLDLGKLRFYWAGDYNSATEYELNDVVRYGGNVYVYINVVKTTGSVPTNTTYWALMVEGFNFVGTWSSATQYYIGDAVAYGSTVYIAITDNINKQPDLFPGNWSQFVEAIQWEGDYNAGSTYQANDLVSYGGNLYIAKATTTGNVPTNTTYWDLFLSGLRSRGDWTTATVYQTNDLVVYGANTYICLIANTSGTFATDLAAGKWQLFNSGVRWRGTWATTTAYIVDDIIRNGGSSYICLVDHTSNDFATDLAAGKWQFMAGDAVIPVIGAGDVGKALGVAADAATLVWVNQTGSTNVFYVAPTGNNSNPGTSLALPFANIQNAIAAVPAGQSAVIYVKNGTYQEALLPMIVPPGVSIIGDSLRNTIVTPAAGLAADGVTPNNQATMWLVSNASLLHKMSFSGMTGWVPGSTAEDIRTSTPKGIYVALNPASPITTKSPYIIECSAFGSGAIAAYMNGSVHASGYKSMVFSNYTCVMDNGVGVWAANGARAEIVSVFTYYAYFGYAASGGGILRSLNGNNSYGTWGSASFGFSATETPHTGALYGEQLTVTTDPITTGFAPGSTITGLTSGATGTVTNLQASAGKVYYKLTSIGTPFQNSEDISDGTNTLTVAPDGVSQQKGFLLVANGFSSAPLPGASIQIAGDSGAYVVQSVSGTYVNSSSILAVALAQEKLTGSPDGAALTIRYQYSQVRLTGHDFLSIGTGGITTTNYPNAPTQPPAQGNEVNEDLPGRVYYVSTDQDGNFRVGEYFRVDQATGTATLNANAFNLSGLTSLRLGSIGAQLGETINEFSADGTLGGNSNTAVPTEQAVKTYVDNAAIPLISTVSSSATAPVGLRFSMDTLAITGVSTVYTVPAGAYHIVLNPNGFALFQ